MPCSPIHENSRGRLDLSGKTTRRAPERVTSVIGRCASLRPMNKAPAPLRTACAHTKGIGRRHTGCVWGAVLDPED